MTNIDIEKKFIEKFSHRFSDIARLADRGNDVGYGKGVAQLEIDITEYIVQQEELHRKELESIMKELDNGIENALKYNDYKAHFLYADVKTIINNKLK